MQHFSSDTTKLLHYAHTTKKNTVSGLDQNSYSKQNT